MPLYPSVSELRSRRLLTVISLLYGLCVGVLPMTRGRRRRYLAPTALVREYLVVAGRLPPGRRDSRIVLLRLDRARWVGRTAPLLHPPTHSCGSPKDHCGCTAQSPPRCRSLVPSARRHAADLALCVAFAIARAVCLVASTQCGEVKCTVLSLIAAVARDRTTADMQRAMCPVDRLRCAPVETFIRTFGTVLYR